MEKRKWIYQAYWVEAGVGYLIVGVLVVCFINLIKQEFPEDGEEMAFTWQILRLATLFLLLICVLAWLGWTINRRGRELKAVLDFEERENQQTYAEKRLDAQKKELNHNSVFFEAFQQMKRKADTDISDKELLNEVRNILKNLPKK